jgi:hypothetical protein
MKMSDRLLISICPRRSPRAPPVRPASTHRRKSDAAPSPSAAASAAVRKWAMGGWEGGRETSGAADRAGVRTSVGYRTTVRRRWRRRREREREGRRSSSSRRRSDVVPVVARLCVARCRLRTRAAPYGGETRGRGSRRRGARRLLPRSRRQTATGGQQRRVRVARRS